MKNNYMIPIECMSKFKKKIEKLNKKAQKLNLKEVELEVLGTTSYKREDNREVPCYEISIYQEEDIKINGYEFVGKLERNVGDTFIYAGEEDVPKEQKEVKVCQHCNSNRFRKLLYILKNEKNEYITVGKSCLIDYIGHKDAEKVAKFYQDVKDLIPKPIDDTLLILEDFESDTEYTPMTYFIDEVIRVALVSIKNRGYIKYDGEKFSTREDVYNTLHKLGKVGARQFRESLEIPKEEVEDIKNFILNMDSNTNYIENLKLLIKDKYVIGKMLGYAVSMPYTVSREKEKLLEKKLEEKNNSKSNFVGIIGEKIEVSVTFFKYNSIETVSPYTGMNEIFRIYTFIDNEGNHIVWKTTAGKDFDIGDKLIIKGTVKDHNEYNGTKQTILTRPSCKYVDGNYKSKYFAEIGETVDMDVTCNKALSVEISEGHNLYTYEFLDKKKNCIVVESYEDKSIRVDDKLNIKGIVRLHEEHKGTKQTFLSKVEFEFKK